MCTASGRKAAQTGLTAERRQGTREIMKSKYVGGKANLTKSVSIGGKNRESLYRSAVSANERNEQRLGAEAGGGSYVNPRAYGGSITNDGNSEAGVSRAVFSNTGPGAGVSANGRTWTGASGRQYAVRSETIEREMGGDSGTTEYSFRSFVGSGERSGLGTTIFGSKNYLDRPDRLKGLSTWSAEDKKKYQNYNVGKSMGRYGVDLGKTEESARAAYKDFGMDFDKDEYRGDFYKTEKGYANLTRSNTQGKEGALRKIHRIRNNGGPNAAAGNTRRKQKKQGNLRISSAGVQGGSTGGGTTLS